MAHRDAFNLNQSAPTQTGCGIVVSTINGRLIPNDLRAGETVGLASVPKDFILLRYNFVITDIDTNATPLHSFQIGDFALANRIAATATTGRAGGTLSTLAATGLFYRFPAETTIVFTTIAAAATGAAGTFSIYLEGFNGGP